MYVIIKDLHKKITLYSNYEYMKIIDVNCGVKNYLKEDHRSYKRNLCSCEKRAIAEVKGSNPVQA